MPKKAAAKRSKTKPKQAVLQAKSVETQPPAVIPEGELPPAPAEWAPAIDAVAEWLLSGGRDQQVLQLLEEQFPELPAMRLVAYALQTIRDAADVDAELLRGWAFLATKETFRKAITANEFGPALRAVKQLLDLAGE